MEQKNMKKGEMSLEYIFKLVIGIIVVFVVIGLIATWATKGKNIFPKWFEDEDKNISGAQIIDLNGLDCSEKQRVIINNARICWQKGFEGQLAGTLCSSIRGASGCTYDFGALQNAYEIGYDGESDRFDITFNPLSKNVTLS